MMDANPVLHKVKPAPAPKPNAIHKKNKTGVPPAVPKKPPVAKLKPTAAAAACGPAHDGKSGGGASPASIACSVAAAAGDVDNINNSVSADTCPVSAAVEHSSENNNNNDCYLEESVLPSEAILLPSSLEAYVPQPDTHPSEAASEARGSLAPPSIESAANHVDETRTNNNADIQPMPVSASPNSVHNPAQKPHPVPKKRLSIRKSEEHKVAVIAQGSAELNTSELVETSPQSCDSDAEHSRDARLAMAAIMQSAFIKKETTPSCPQEVSPSHPLQKKALHSHQPQTETMSLNPPRKVASPSNPPEKKNNRSSPIREDVSPARPPRRPKHMRKSFVKSQSSDSVCLSLSQEDISTTTSITEPSDETSKTSQTVKKQRSLDTNTGDSDKRLLDSETVTNEAQGYVSNSRDVKAEGFCTTPKSGNEINVSPLRPQASPPDPPTVLPQGKSETHVNKLASNLSSVISQSLKEQLENKGRPKPPVKPKIRPKETLPKENGEDVSRQTPLRRSGSYEASLDAPVISPRDQTEAADVDVETEKQVPPKKTKVHSGVRVLPADLIKAGKRTKDSTDINEKEEYGFMWQASSGNLAMSQSVMDALPDQDDTATTRCQSMLIETPINFAKQKVVRSQSEQAINVPTMTPACKAPPPPPDVPPPPLAPRQRKKRIKSGGGTTPTKSNTPPLLVPTGKAPVKKVGGSIQDKALPPIPCEDAEASIQRKCLPPVPHEDKTGVTPEDVDTDIRPRDSMYDPEGYLSPMSPEQADGLYSYAELPGIVRSRSDASNINRVPPLHPRPVRRPRSQSDTPQIPELRESQEYSECDDYSMDRGSKGLRNSFMGHIYEMIKSRSNTLKPDAQNDPSSNSIFYCDDSDSPDEQETPVEIQSGIPDEKGKANPPQAVLTLPVKCSEPNQAQSATIDIDKPERESRDSINKHAEKAKDEKGEQKQVQVTMEKPEAKQARVKLFCPEPSKTEDLDSILDTPIAAAGDDSDEYDDARPSIVPYAARDIINNPVVDDIADDFSLDIVIPPPQARKEMVNHGYTGDDGEHHYDATPGGNRDSTLDRHTYEATSDTDSVASETNSDGYIYPDAQHQPVAGHVRPKSPTGPPPPRPRHRDVPTPPAPPQRSTSIHPEESVIQLPQHSTSIKPEHMYDVSEQSDTQPVPPQRSTSIHPPPRSTSKQGQKSLRSQNDVDAAPPLEHSSVKSNIDGSPREVITSVKHEHTTSTEPGIPANSQSNEINSTEPPRQYPESCAIPLVHSIHSNDTVTDASVMENEYSESQEPILTSSDSSYDDSDGSHTPVEHEYAEAFDVSQRTDIADTSEQSLVCEDTETDETLTRDSAHNGFKEALVLAMNSASNEYHLYDDTIVSEPQITITGVTVEESTDYQDSDKPDKPLPPEEVIMRRLRATSGSDTSSERPESWGSSSSDHVPDRELSLMSGSSFRSELSFMSGSSFAPSISDHSDIEEESPDVKSTPTKVGHVPCRGRTTLRRKDEPQEIQDKRKKKAFNIVREIVTTEETFIGVLKLLNKDFRESILRAGNALGRPVAPAQVVNNILKFLPQLQNFNEDLLKDLKSRVDEWHKNPQIADIFIKKGPFLKLYTSYIRDFENTTAAFEDARKKYPEFESLVKSFESSPKCKNLAIKHYMLKPIQRIPQYRLLLQDYLKQLREDTEEYQQTKAALVIVSEVAEHANQSIKYGDNFKKLWEIQNCLIGQFEVIKPGRSFIKEGMLNKLSRKEMQPRMFFLLNDVLLYTTPVSGGYKLNNAIPLSSMKVTLPSKEDFQNEFNIISTQRSFTISASTPEERDEWLSILQETIGENKQKRHSFDVRKYSAPSVVSIGLDEDTEDLGFKLGSRAPVWVPDARVSMCMICTEEFTITFRRHHCRACGKIVCGYCSDNKAPLRYLQYKPARVCTPCFDKLLKDSETEDIQIPAEPSPGESPLTVASVRARFKGFNWNSFRRSKSRRPAVLHEVQANDGNAEMSGYLKLWKGRKWKKRWFVLKEKALFTYKASEDTAAVESLVLLGFEVRTFTTLQKLQHAWFEGMEPGLVFELTHRNTTPMTFRTESVMSRDKWVHHLREATMP